jgi:hypothetical protein
MALAPVGRLSDKTSETSKPPRVRPSCSFIPTARSPNPELIPTFAAARARGAHEGAVECKREALYSE